MTSRSKEELRSLALKASILSDRQNTVRAPDLPIKPTVAPKRPRDSLSTNKEICSPETTVTEPRCVRHMIREERRRRRRSNIESIGKDADQTLEQLSSALADVQQAFANHKPVCSPTNFSSTSSQVSPSTVVSAADREQLKALHIQVAELNDEVEKQKEELRSAATAREANNVALEHASAKHKELEDSLAVHASTVAALQSELATKTTEITQLKSADSAMKSQAAELEKALAKVALLEEQARADTATIAELRAENDGLRTAAGEHKKSIKELQKQLSDEAAMEQQMAELRQQLADAEEAHNAAIASATEAEEKYQVVERLREELQEELLDLKGNIRVFARVRPCLAHERKQQESSHRLFRFDRTDRGEGVLEMVAPDAQDVTGTMRPGKAMEWTFNRVFSPIASQAEIFTEVKGMIYSAMAGRRATIFAYGQTGSGKTYTMQGCVSSAATADGSSTLSIQTDACSFVTAQSGIIPRALQLLFDRKQVMERDGWEVTMHASMLEMYMDKLGDLLADLSRTDEAGGATPTTTTPTGIPKRATTRAMTTRARAARKTATGSASVATTAAAATSGTVSGSCSTPVDMRMDSKGVTVTGLSQHKVENEADCVRLLNTAAATRATAATKLNATSSRSHAIFSIEITAVHGESGEVKQGTLKLIDLAGSENLKRSGAADDKTLAAEATSINKSLSALGKVMSELQSGSSHVSFRDSKLTALLQPSLTGDGSRALMVCNLSPLADHLQESQKSLRFAHQVAACTTSS